MNIEQLHHRFNDKPATIVVVGSINLDLISFVDSFPLPNQTIHAHESNLDAGGKGFNQAIAAARAGASVFFVGCVGDDAAGQTAVDILKDNGVDTQFVRKVDDVHTGTANILVANGGSNMIAVSAGANAQVMIQDVVNASELIESADILLCQLECPIEVVEFALKKAKSMNVASVLNPAPAVDGANKLMGLADYVTPNEVEALEFTSLDPTQKSQRQLASDTLKSQESSNGSMRSVITLGPEGAYLSDNNGSNYMLNAFKVSAINTTGAGDIFNGAFVCGLARNYSFVDSAIYASAASAISVTGKSTYDSAPRHSEIIEFISHQPDCSSMLEKVS